MFPRLPRLGARTRDAVGVALLSIAFYTAGRYNFTLIDVAIGIWNVFLLLWSLTPWGSSPPVAEMTSPTSTRTYVVNRQILPTRTSAASSGAFNPSSMCPLRSTPALSVPPTSPANMTVLTTPTSVEVVAITTKAIFAGKQAIRITATAPEIPTRAINITEETPESHDEPANATEQTSARFNQAVNITKNRPETSKQAANVTTPTHKACKDPPYKVRILSYSPLVIYIQNFVTRAERKHLIALAANKYERSQVVQSGTNFDGVEGRTSSTSILEKGDPVVDCIRLRAARFQGKSNPTHVEDLNIVRYQKTQKFDYHFDWFPELPHKEEDAWDRWTSFFVFLEANGTVGGTTHFPKVRAPGNRDKEMCRYVECAEGVQSLAVKPVVGNAVFWVNRFPSGKRDQRSVHAGKEVLHGTKIGMNIWTSERARDLFVDETEKEF